MTQPRFTWVAAYIGRDEPLAHLATSPVLINLSTVEEIATRQSTNDDQPYKLYTLIRFVSGVELCVANPVDELADDILNAD